LSLHHVKESSMSTAPVLICYDGSDDARRAISVTAGILGPRSAVVLDVEPVLTPAESYAVMASAATGVEFEGLNAREGLARADEGAALARAAGFDAVPRSALAAETWEGVLDVADEVDAAAIVIGSHGTSGVRALIEGSVSHDVARHSRRPLLVVPPRRRATTPADDAPVLICYDGSTGAQHAVDAAAALLGPRRAVVLDVGPPLTPAESVAVTAPVSPAFAFEQLNADDALVRAETGAERARRAGFVARARGDVAAPTWEGIVDVADEIEAALIVTGSRGLNGVRELFEGSVSHQVVEHAGRPVLIVPAADGRH
jgi:nucleotide-binding universal stress UspA family protein